MAPFMEMFGLAVFFIPSPNDEILVWSKLKAFADDKSNIAQIVKFASERFENIVGNGANAGKQKRPLSVGCSNSGLCSKELKQKSYIFHKI